jgi:hypothetical protein
MKHTKTRWAGSLFALTLAFATTSSACGEEKDEDTEESIVWLCGEEKDEDTEESVVELCGEEKDEDTDES